MPSEVRYPAINCQLIKETDEGHKYMKEYWSKTTIRACGNRGQVEWDISLECYKY